MKARSWAVIMIILVMIFSVECDNKEDLKDETLLSSLPLVTPKTLSFKAEDVSSREGEQKIEIRKYYISEGSVRYEFKSLVYVYDKENEMIYEWDEQSGEGIFYSNEGEVVTSALPELGKTREDVNGDGLLNGLDYLPRGCTLTAAKLTEWDGYEVVYMDLSVDSPMVSQMELWMSTEYGIPLKIVAYSRSSFYSPSDEVIKETKLSEISVDPIDPTMFLPPDDINFVKKTEERI